MHVSVHQKQLAGKVSPTNNNNNNNNNNNINNDNDNDDNDNDNDNDNNNNNNNNNNNKIVIIIIVIIKIIVIMKALKCKPSVQFAFKYTINVLSKCSNIISHRPSIFKGRHIDHPSSKVDTTIIDPRRSTHRSSIFESRHIDLRRSSHRSSIFEGRHIDLQRSKAETSHRQPNITPTFRQFVTEYCPHANGTPCIRFGVVRVTIILYTPYGV